MEIAVKLYGGRQETSQKPLNYMVMEVAELDEFTVYYVYHIHL